MDSINLSNWILKKNDNLLNVIKAINFENKLLRLKLKKQKNCFQNKKIRKVRTKPSINELRFNCPSDICNSKYRKNSNLITHIRIKHSDLYKIPRLKNGRRNSLTNSKVNFDDFKIIN